MTFDFCLVDERAYQLQLELLFICSCCFLPVLQIINFKLYLRMEDKHKKKIAISLNLDWPLKRYHDLYAGIQLYNKKNCDWSLVWDHFPANILKNCAQEPYYSGVIGRIKHDTFNEASRLNIPLVNTWMTSTLSDLPSVFADYEEAGRLAAEHLIRRGFRHLINIDYSANRSSRIFFQSFANTAKINKCSVSQHLFSPKAEESRSQWAKFYHEFSAWIKTWKLPVGIACSLSSLGPKVTTRLLENGLRIPDDAAVITAGNDPAFCESSTPPITSIDLDFHNVGYECGRLMDELLQGRELLEKHLVVEPIHIIPRDSTDIYVSEDEEVKKALRFIAGNFNEPIQVEDIVSQLSISRRSLEIRFQKETGKSINKEINRLRINAVKRILTSENVKVSKIFRDFGFSNVRHFNRTFLNYTGMTPGEYIKNHR